MAQVARRRRSAGNGLLIAVLVLAVLATVPIPIRTRMRAAFMPGEAPATLDTPEQVADYIVPLCLPAFTQTGKLYDYPSKSLLSFRPPSA